MGRDDSQRARDGAELSEGRSASPERRRRIALAPGDVEVSLDELYVAAGGASLRREERRKAVQVAALLDELIAVLPRAPRRPLTIVDAAAGKAYVGLLAIRHALPALASPQPPARVVIIEREAPRLEAAQRAARILGGNAQIEWRLGDVAEAALWPEQPDAVLALHACGPAADHVIDRAIATGARSVLLVPCCTSTAVRAMDEALRAAERLGIPRQAPVRRRFLQSFIDAERTLRLESAGFKTEVVELTPPTITPHNLMWRARRVGEPHRAADASRALASLLGRP